MWPNFVILTILSACMNAYIYIYIYIHLFLLEGGEDNKFII